MPRIQKKGASRLYGPRPLGSFIAKLFVLLPPCYLGVVPDVPLFGYDDPVLFDVPGLVVPLLGYVLPGRVEDPGVGVEYGGVVDDGSPGVAVPAVPGVELCGVAVSLVVPGAGVEPGACCSGNVPGAIVPEELGVLDPG